LRKTAVNKEYLGAGAPVQCSILLEGALFDARNSPYYQDFSFIKHALKSICRENGIERDRRARVEVAAMVIALFQEGARSEGEIVERARQRWSEARIQ
jgi:hypothetical protein